MIAAQVPTTAFGVPTAVNDVFFAVCRGRTSVPGVWAAGNVVDPRVQVITAAGAGSAAAIPLNADLVEDDVRNAVRDFNRGFLP